MIQGRIITISSTIGSHPNGGSAGVDCFMIEVMDARYAGRGQ